MFTHDVYAVYRHNKTSWVPTLHIGEVASLWRYIGIIIIIICLTPLFRGHSGEDHVVPLHQASRTASRTPAGRIKSCRVNNPPVVVAYQCWQNMKGLLRLSHYIDIYSMPASIHICPVRNVRTT